MSQHADFAKPAIRRWIRDHADKGAYRSKSNETRFMWLVAMTFAVIVLVMT